MYAVLGLGNPGEQYRLTRHNLGFKVVEALAIQLQAKWQESGLYLFASGKIEGVPVVLVKPVTFVNRTGLAAVELEQQFPVSTKELLVVLDDVNLSLGKMRLRLKGSDGGHKGLATLIYELRSQEFPRLRLGIGPAPEGADLRGFVLGEFEEEELPAVETLVSRAIKTVKVFIGSGSQRAVQYISQSEIS